jgi:hypothetical protein
VATGILSALAAARSAPEDGIGLCGSPSWVPASDWQNHICLWKPTYKPVWGSFFFFFNDFQPLYAEGWLNRSSENQTKESTLCMEKLVTLFTIIITSCARGDVNMLGSTSKRCTLTQVHWLNNQGSSWKHCSQQQNIRENPNVYWF